MPAELRDSGTRERVANSVCRSVVGNIEECPMSWVTNQWGPNETYNTRRSAFWRVSRRVCEQLNIGDMNNWSSHLVWSNLYKVAPATGGNPNDRLCNIQYSGCVDLFCYELKKFRPSQVLMLTGKDWANDFIDQMKSVLDYTVNRDFDYVDRSGILTTPNNHRLRFVVAKHPQGKPEEVWTEQVINTIASIR